MAGNNLKAVAVIDQDLVTPRHKVLWPWELHRATLGNAIFSRVLDSANAMFSMVLQSVLQSALWFCNQQVSKISVGKGSIKEVNCEMTKFEN